MLQFMMQGDWDSVCWCRSRSRRYSLTSLYFPFSQWLSETISSTMKASLSCLHSYYCKNSDRVLDKDQTQYSRANPKLVDGHFLFRIADGAFPRRIVYTRRKGYIVTWQDIYSVGVLRGSRILWSDQALNESHRRSGCMHWNLQNYL
jgi:hypothetical protein